jgi:hypothetical protein
MLKLEIKYKIEDVENKKILIEKPSDSGVLNLVKAIHSLITPKRFSGERFVSTTNTNQQGINIILDYDYETAPYNGICVGSSQIPYDINQYNLQSLITHGTGTGQLQYGSNNVSFFSINGTTATWTINKTFSNESGNTVNINEIGIIHATSSEGGLIFLMLRDVLPSTIALQNQKSIRIEYAFTLNV